MKVVIVKSFGYGHDGIHVVQTVVGEEVDIRDELIPGLVAEGFVAAPAKTKPKRERLPLPLGGDETPSAKPQRNRSAG